MFYYIYYVLFNDNSYKPIVIIAVYDTLMILISFILKSSMNRYMRIHV